MHVFDDTLRARSLAIIDSASIQQVAEGRQLFADAGVLRVFQPAYSPDFNVAEFIFSLVKRRLKEYEDVELETYAS